jgi:hypothetical protein
MRKELRPFLAALLLALKDMHDKVGKGACAGPPSAAPAGLSHAG